MTPQDIIHSLCFKHQYLRQLQAKEYSQDKEHQHRLILNLKSQIWGLKRRYLESRQKPKGMLYEYNGRYFLATREITHSEFMEYRNLGKLKVA